MTYPGTAGDPPGTAHALRVFVERVGELALIAEVVARELAKITSPTGR
jgi:hypothetical protein